MLKSRRWAVVLVLSIGIVSSGFVWMQENSTQTQNLPYLGKYSESLGTLKVPSSFSLEKMYGTSYPSIEVLSAVTNSRVTESTSLPTGLEVKALLTKGTASEKARLTTVIYGPGSIDYDQLETFADVMDSYGVIVLYSEERDDFNIEQWYMDVLAERPNTQSAMLNGFSAIGVNGDPEQGTISKLIFHDGRTQIQLVSAAYVLSDLIRIASTL